MASAGISPHDAIVTRRGHEYSPDRLPAAATNQLGLPARAVAPFSTRGSVAFMPIATSRTGRVSRPESAAPRHPRPAKPAEVHAHSHCVDGRHDSDDAAKSKLKYAALTLNEFPRYVLIRAGFVFQITPNRGRPNMATESHAQAEQHLAQARLDRVAPPRKAEEQATDLARQKNELLALRRQFHDEQQERMDLLAKLQASLDESMRRSHEREQRIQLMEQEAAQRAERHRHESAEFARRTADHACAAEDLDERRRAFDQLRQVFETEKQQARNELNVAFADLAEREQKLAAKEHETDEKAKRYGLDLLRLDAIEERLALREKAVRDLEETVGQKQADLDAEGAELEEQFFRLDEHRATLLDEAQRLTKQKHEHDETEARLARSAVALDEQLAASTATRLECERLETSLGRRAAELDARRARQEQVEQSLTAQKEEQARRDEEFKRRHEGLAAERERWAEQIGALESSRHHAQETQRNVDQLEWHLQARAADVAEQAGRLANAQEQLTAREKLADERSRAAEQKEGEYETAAERLRLRADEITALRERTSERERELNVRLASLDERQEAFDREDQEWRQRHAAQQADLNTRRQTVERQDAELTGKAAEIRGRAERLLQLRRSIADARKDFQEEQQRVLAHETKTRASFESLHREATVLLRQLPESETSTAEVSPSLGGLREQLRRFLNAGAAAE